MSRRKKRQKNHKLPIMLAFTFIIITLIFGAYAVDRQLLPKLVEVTEMSVRAKINNSIYESLKNYSTEKMLASEDFYVKSVDGTGRIYSLSINTMLVNDICASLAAEISEDMQNLDHEKIEIPLGELLDISFLANFGPKYNITVLPKGNALVDYETEFTSQGINQINFQLWLNVSVKAEIVNPFRKSDISVERKVLLVNTVFAGEIPDSYFNFPQK